MFLGDQTIRELLKQFDALGKGSQFQREAAEYYFELAFRKAINLPFTEADPENLINLSKAELKEKLPTLSHKELDDMAKARLTAIQETAEKFANRVTAITDSFLDQMEQYMTETIVKAFSERFSDERINAIVDAKISKLPEATQKIFYQAVYGDTPLRLSQLESFLDQKLSRKEVN